MVLKLTRNRILFQNISRNPQKFASKIEYELKKYLAIRLDRKTIQDVVKMDKELVPAVAETLATFQPEISSDDDIPQEATIARVNARITIHCPKRSVSFGKIIRISTSA